MEHATPDAIKKHVRTYVIVFVSLMALTVVTVAISYLHLDVAAAVIVAMFIATIKGALVASYFMHLISEKRLIFMALVLTFIFFVALIYRRRGPYSLYDPLYSKNQTSSFHVRTENHDQESVDVRIGSDRCCSPG